MKGHIEQRHYDETSQRKRRTIKWVTTKQADNIENVLQLLKIWTSDSLLWAKSLYLSTDRGIIQFAKIGEN